MTSECSRRGLLIATGVLLATILGGCADLLSSVRQPYGDLVIRNRDTRSHVVAIEGTNEYAREVPGGDSGTIQFDTVVESQSTVHEEQFFVSGDSVVTVSVDGNVVGDARVEIWRGEGGDQDRREERLTVTIDESGETEVAVRITHTPPYRTKRRAESARPV